MLIPLTISISGPRLSPKPGVSHKKIFSLCKGPTFFKVICTGAIKRVSDSEYGEHLTF
jgi:hypothetical protein